MMMGEIHQPDPYKQIPLVVHQAQKFAFQIAFSVPFAVNKPCIVCNIVEFEFTYLSSSTNI